MYILTIDEPKQPLKTKTTFKTKFYKINRPFNNNGQVDATRWLILFRDLEVDPS